MNRTNYNKHHPQIVLDLTCAKCDTPFKRSVPRMKGANPTKGLCIPCKEANKSIAFGIEGGGRQTKRNIPEGGFK